MICKTVSFSDHAVGQMFKRGISVDEVKAVLSAGEVIADYPTDKPYPSCLLLGYVEKRPIHAVVAKEEETEKCIVITAYIPDLTIWNPGFKVKRQ